MMYLTCWLKIKAWCYVRMKVTFLLRYFWRWFAIEICILVVNHIHVDKCEKVWMGKNILIIQEMYLTGLEYIFVRNTWNTCISDEDTFETGQTHPVYCQDICSHSYLFFIVFLHCISNSQFLYYPEIPKWHPYLMIIVVAFCFLLFFPVSHIA